MSTDQNSGPPDCKLRASCDSCFHAKVKCSKGRPICSRCLASGADCQYSPSCRVGKPRSDCNRRNNPYISRDLSSSNNSRNIDGQQPTSNRLNTDWSTSSGPSSEHLDEILASSATLPLLGDESSSEAESSAINAGLFRPVSWTNTPRTDFIADASISSSLTPWLGGQIDYINLTSNVGLDSPPCVYANNSMAKSPTCNCFNTCLQALQALHNSSGSTNSVPPFDVVLTINQNAMDGCTMMLNCPVCVSRSGNSITTMLLGTIIAKVMSIYQDASKHYFGFRHGPSSQIQPLPLTLGTYRVAGEDGRWLEMEIILRDLEKLKELFAKFREKAETSNREEDAKIHGAVTNYLCHILHLTCEVLDLQKNIKYG